MAAATAALGAFGRVWEDGQQVRWHAEDDAALPVEATLREQGAVRQHDRQRCDGRHDRQCVVSAVKEVPDERCGEMNGLADRGRCSRCATRSVRLVADFIKAGQQRLLWWWLPCFCGLAFVHSLRCQGMHVRDTSDAHLRHHTVDIAHGRFGAADAPRTSFNTSI